MKRNLAILGVSLISALAMAPLAKAEDNCGFSALLQGGGMLDQELEIDNGTSLPQANWLAGFGEGALAFGCGPWHAQGDAALYQFGATISGNSASQTHSHFGGAAYWRDASVGAIGMSASEIAIADSGAGGIFTGSGSVFRYGGFAEFYAGEMFTFGGGLHHVSGTVPWAGGGQTNLNGFEGEAYAKVYASSNLAFTLRGDALSESLNYSFYSPFPGNGLAASAEAEYLVPDTALSLFAGARFAHREFTDINDRVLNDTQEFVGLRFSIGGTPPQSLSGRDRAGVYDNTSTFFEKLPDFTVDWSLGG